MTQLTRVIRRQLQLPLQTMSASPPLVGQVRSELIEALSDLLREALGTETSQTLGESEVSDECKDHV
jgi:hypothetical protein